MHPLAPALARSLRIAMRDDVTQMITKIVIVRAASGRVYRRIFLLFLSMAARTRGRPLDNRHTGFCQRGSCRSLSIAIDSLGGQDALVRFVVFLDYSAVVDLGQGAVHTHLVVEKTRRLRSAELVLDVLRHLGHVQRLSVALVVLVGYVNDVLGRIVDLLDEVCAGVVVLVDGAVCCLVHVDLIGLERVGLGVEQLPGGVQRRRARRVERRVDVGLERLAVVLASAVRGLGLAHGFVIVAHFVLVAFETLDAKAFTDHSGRSRHCLRYDAH